MTIIDTKITVFKKKNYTLSILLLYFIWAYYILDNILQYTFGQILLFLNHCSSVADRRRFRNIINVQEVKSFSKTRTFNCAQWPHRLHATTMLLLVYIIVCPGHNVTTYNMVIHIYIYINGVYIIIYDLDNVKIRHNTVHWTIYRRSTMSAEHW